MRELIYFHSRGVVLETILDAKASYGTEKETDRQKKKSRSRQVNAGCVTMERSFEGSLDWTANVPLDQSRLNTP